MSPSHHMSAGSQQIPAIGGGPYARLMGVVSRYLSARTAITLVNQSLVELDLTPEAMTQADLAPVIEAAMPSLRAFVPDAQIDDLVIDLAVISRARPISGVITNPSDPPRTSMLPNDPSRSSMRPSERPSLDGSIFSSTRRR